MNQRIREIYPEITTILQPEVETPIPPLVFTKSKKFWGRIRRWNDHDYIDIRINTVAFGQIWGTDKFETQIRSTICHEIAHMDFWDHSQNHTNLTQRYIDMVIGAPAVAPVIQTVAHSTITSLTDLVSDTRRARAQLRKAGISRPGTRWEWEGDLPQDVIDTLGL